MAIFVPEWATGLRLCKVVNDELRMSEAVQFVKGRAAVDTVLRRAAISGNVGPVGGTGDYWADFLDINDDWAETVALDKAAWNSLKNHWMRCKMWGASPATLTAPSASAQGGEAA